MPSACISAASSGETSPRAPAAASSSLRFIASPRWPTSLVRPRDRDVRGSSRFRSACPSLARSPRHRDRIARASAVGARRVLAPRGEPVRNGRLHQTGSDRLRASRIAGCTRGRRVRRARQDRRQPRIHEARQTHPGSAGRVHDRFLRAQRGKHAPDGESGRLAVDGNARGRRALPRHRDELSRRTAELLLARRPGANSRRATR